MVFFLVLSLMQQMEIAAQRSRANFFMDKFILILIRCSGRSFSIRFRIECLNLKLYNSRPMAIAKSSRKYLRFFRIIAINIFVSFMLVETVLHIFPTELTDYQSNITYVSDKYLGYIPEPNQDAPFNIKCLRVPHLLTNSDGMRGGEWSNEGSPKIALLGDSYLLGYTINEKFHIANLLKAATKGEIWNTGVSGYGTYQELLIWRKLIRDRKPDITVLFVYLENDIRDNQFALCRAEGQIYSPSCEVKEGKIVERTDFEVREKQSALKAWIKANCYTSRLINNLAKMSTKKKEHGNFFEKESFAYNVYRPGFSQNWEDGWHITEWALNELKKECDSVGSKLLIVNVPGVIQLAYDLKAELKSQIGTDSMPSGFQLDYPIRRLQTIADSADIQMCDMQPEFLRYRDLHKLQNPLFGWCFDGHWNPIGHQLAADLVYNELLGIGWLEGSDNRETPKPVDVLGEELFKKLYNCETVELE